MTHALYLAAIQAVVFLTGYVFGRVRPLRWLFRPEPAPDDPHLRTVHGANGPVQIFNPNGR